MGSQHNLGQTHQASGLQIGLLEVDRWPEYKELRLEALEMEASAYCTTHAKASTITDQEWRRRLENSNFDSGSILLFASISDRLVGMVGAGEDDPGVAGITSMYVNASFRGVGVGKALLAAILQRIRDEKRFKEAQLTVNGDQGPALNLYLSLGFKVVASKRDVMGDGLEHEHLLMSLPL